MHIRLNLLSCIFGAVSLASSLAQGQSGSDLKTLVIDRPVGNDPVRITNVMLGTNALKSDGRQFPNQYAWETAFKAGDDWIRDVVLVVRNVSTKEITYMTASCVLFETADWQAEFAKHSNSENPAIGSASNVVGWRPEHALSSSLSVESKRVQKPDSAYRPAFELDPGHEFSLPIEAPGDYESLRSRVEAKQDMSTMNACSGGINEVFFEDGTQWQHHNYLRPADQPGRYTNISFDEWSRYSQEPLK